MKKYTVIFCFLFLGAVIITFTLFSPLYKEETPVKTEISINGSEILESKEENESKGESLINSQQSTKSNDKFYIILTSENAGGFYEVCYESEEDRKDKSIDDYIAVSTHSIIGEFVKATFVEDYLIEYEFKNCGKIYGNEDDDIIRVRVQSYDYGYIAGNLTENSFIKGHKYILILSRDETLFLEYPYYSFMGYFVLDIEDIQNGKWKNGTVHISKTSTSDDVIDYIKNTSKTIGFQKCEIVNYFRTEDNEAVIKNCDAIFKVKPVNILVNGVYDNRTVYMCTVPEVYKGKLETNEEKFVFIVAFRDSLELGREYILPVSYVKAEYFYHQASPTCIFDADDSEMEAKIKEWLSEKKIVNG